VKQEGQDRGRDYGARMVPVTGESPPAGEIGEDRPVPGIAADFGPAPGTGRNVRA